LQREALAPPALEDPEVEAFIKAAVAMGFGEDELSPRVKQQGGGGGGIGDVFWPAQMASMRPCP